MNQPLQNQVAARLIHALDQKEATIGIIGMGYVGLPLALSYAEKGYQVIGFDIDPKIKEAINSRRSHISHISSARIEQAVNGNRLKVTEHFESAKECDALIICVPTPLSKHREPDLSFITMAAHAISPFMREGQIVSLESTTYPGTTKEVLVPILEKSGHRVGEDIFVVFSPEREDPGNKSYETTTIPKVMGGDTTDCADVGEALYRNVITRVVRVSSTRAAELTKLLENIHRAVNIGLVNEIKLIADAMHIDIHEVINAAATKPFGFVAYRPGPGLGGHCIPIDPFYLAWKAKEYGLQAKFIELAGEINSQMPTYVVSKIQESLNRHKLSVSAAKILIVGVAYKKNIDDIRESPAIEIINQLLLKDADISFADPHVQLLSIKKQTSMAIKQIDLDTAELSIYNCVVIVTDHDCFNYSRILRDAQIIVDTRGIFNFNEANVVRA